MSSLKDTGRTLLDENKSAALRGKENTARFRHVKRGSTYTLIGWAVLQSSGGIVEGTRLTIYQDEKDGNLWARPEIEFDDGRFERIDAALRGKEGEREITSLTAERDELREALERIAKWSAAYPVDIFPEPDFAKVHELLQANGMTLDAISASNMRFVTKGVGEIALAALRGKDEE